MIDCQDRHEAEAVVGLVDDSKVTSASAVFAFQVEPKGSPHTMWAFGQPAVHELDAGGCDLLGQTIE